MNKIVLFLLLMSITNDVAASRNSVNTTDQKTICAQRADTLKLLYGHDGQPGVPGAKGEPGPKGYAGIAFFKGSRGPPGRRGTPGYNGMQGMKGDPGEPGVPGVNGRDGLTGERGDRGLFGPPGPQGDRGQKGRKGDKGYKGSKGKAGAKMEQEMEIYTLNGYFVSQSGYYNNRYHVTSRVLTDGRSDTGGWGSESENAGNYIQATYIRPVYVTSLTVAGGFISSWGHDVRPEYADLDLEYSFDGKSWLKARTIPAPVQNAEMIFYDLPQPVTAKYWRLRSTENKWAGTTEFSLKPLIRQ
ncbi:ficolin-1-like [Dendronephthya gigantea]|uniref:ficolin-1-like n=1 Tax=Dendronephthya gigantea TaxID=151771 RepID=UPI00106DA218|nr:ficolin-1-like [Dendronephthya gigantea]